MGENKKQTVYNRVRKCDFFAARFVEMEKTSEEYGKLIGGGGKEEGLKWKRAAVFTLI